MIRHRSLHDPIRRGVALAVAMAFHLAVLISMAWPVIHGRNNTRVEGSPPHAIRIRFFRPPSPPSARRDTSAPQVIAPAVHVRTTQPLKRPIVQHATGAAPLPTEAYSFGSPAASVPVAGIKDAIGDGGFQERLLEAQHSYAVRGIPGSDKPFVPGIRSIDPRKQGVGAVMRQAQRLFGVTDRHCIDVDVWRNLAPQELIARHTSPNEVDRTDEKYDCNRPLGLSF